MFFLDFVRECNVYGDDTVKALVALLSADIS
jgi:hypothetical protein